ncbi:hypothetical protein GQ457_11G004350 [Hibiscus cannabinus]
MGRIGNDFALLIPSSTLAELPPLVRTDIANGFGFEEVKDLGKYLGVPLLHSRVSKATYAYLLEKMRATLPGWVAKTLTLAGRITLAKAVLQAIPIYVMQSSWLPKGTCEDMERLIRRFVWGTTEGDGSQTGFWFDNWLGQHGRLTFNCTGDTLLPSTMVKDMTTDLGNWDWSQLSPVLPQSILEQIAAVPPPQNCYGFDTNSPAMVPQSWSRPPMGWIKANVDASVNLADGKAAMGILKRSSHALMDNNLVESILLWTRKEWQLVVQHVPRQQNSIVDRLAALGRSSSSNGLSLPFPPTDLISLIEEEKVRNTCELLSPEEWSTVTNVACFNLHIDPEG